MGDDDEPVVITEETILKEAADRGFGIERDEACNAYVISFDGKEAHLPMAFANGGYTDDQLDQIEDAFVGTGVDLFPLRGHIH